MSAKITSTRNPSLECMKIYCMHCKEPTETVNVQCFSAKNGYIMNCGNCCKCGHCKAKFAKRDDCCSLYQEKDKQIAKAKRSYRSKSSDCSKSPPRGKEVRKKLKSPCVRPDDPCKPVEKKVDCEPKQEIGTVILTEYVTAKPRRKRSPKCRTVRSRSPKCRKVRKCTHYSPSRKRISSGKGYSGRRRSSGRSPGRSRSPYQGRGRSPYSGRGRAPFPSRPLSSRGKSPFLGRGASPYSGRGSPRGMPYRGQSLQRSRSPGMSRSPMRYDQDLPFCDELQARTCSRGAGYDPCHSGASGRGYPCPSKSPGLPFCDDLRRSKSPAYGLGSKSPGLPYCNDPCLDRPGSSRGQEIIFCRPTSSRHSATPHFGEPDHIQRLSGFEKQQWEEQEAESTGCFSSLVKCMTCKKKGKKQDVFVATDKIEPKLVIRCNNCGALKTEFTDEEIMAMAELSQYC